MFLVICAVVLPDDAEEVSSEDGSRSLVSDFSEASTTESSRSSSPLTTTSESEGELSLPSVDGEESLRSLIEKKVTKFIEDIRRQSDERQKREESAEDKEGCTEASSDAVVVPVRGRKRKLSFSLPRPSKKFRLSLESWVPVWYSLDEIAEFFGGLSLR